MLTAVLLIAVLLSVTVQLKSPVPPVLQGSCVSPVIVPVAVTAGAPTPRSNMFGLTATEISAAGRPGGVVQVSPVKFVSVTLQFASAADPVFVTVIVTALLPLVSRRAQSLVTVRPGV